MKLAVVMQAGLAAVILVAAPSLVHAQQQQFGGPGGNTYLTWSSAPQQMVDVTYFVDNTMSNVQANSIRIAAQTWNNAGTGVHLVEVNSQAAGNIRFDSANLGGNLSQVAFSSITPGAGTYPNGTNWFQITGPVTA